MKGTKTLEPKARTYHRSVCNICRSEYTSNYVEAMPGLTIHVCRNCLELTKHHFMWICLNCGRVYSIPKAMIMQRINNLDLKKACLLSMDMQIIQGIDACIECDPEGTWEYTGMWSPIAQA